MKRPPSERKKVDVPSDDGSEEKLNYPIQKYMIHLRNAPCAAPILQLMVNYDPVTSFQEQLPTTGECRIAIMMDARKMITELILITQMMMRMCRDDDRTDTEIMDTKQ